MVGPGIEPQRMDKESFSHLDIFPTVMDLVGEEDESHIAGSSIFSKGTRNPVYLVQPYQGISLGIIHDQVKYVKHFLYKKEELFDLEDDPGETKNLIDDPKMKEKINVFRYYLGYFFLNQENLSRDEMVSPLPRPE